MSRVERILAICRGIRERGLKIRWGCDAHVRQIEPELVRELAAANCYELSLGLESGVQRLLNRVRKGIKIEHSRRAVECIRNHSKISVEGLFILGLPGETPAETEQTIRFAPVTVAEDDGFYVKRARRVHVILGITFR